MNSTAEVANFSRLASVKATSENESESVQPPMEIIFLRWGFSSLSACNSAKLPASPFSDCSQVYFPPKVVWVAAQGSKTSTSPSSSILAKA